MTAATVVIVTHRYTFVRLVNQFCILDKMDHITSSVNDFASGQFNTEQNEVSNLFMVSEMILTLSADIEVADDPFVQKPLLFLYDKLKAFCRYCNELLGRMTFPGCSAWKKPVAAGPN